MYRRVDLQTFLLVINCRDVCRDDCMGNCMDVYKAVCTGVWLINCIDVYRAVYVDDYRDFLVYQCCVLGEFWSSVLSFE